LAHLRRPDECPPPGTEDLNTATLRRRRLLWPAAVLLLFLGAGAGLYAALHGLFANAPGSAGGSPLAADAFTGRDLGDRGTPATQPLQGAARSDSSKSEPPQVSPSGPPIAIAAPDDRRERPVQKPAVGPHPDRPVPKDLDRRIADLEKELFQTGNDLKFGRAIMDLQNTLARKDAEAASVARQFVGRKQVLVPDDQVSQLLDEMARDRPIPAAKLLLQIAHARRVIDRFQRGHIVVGRLRVEDGKLEPELVLGQMQILPDGYFAGELADLHRPICFRAPGYQNLEVPLQGKQGHMVYVGLVTLKPLPKEQQVSWTGKVVLDGAKTPEAAEVRVNMTVGPVNTPHNGLSGRPRWPEPTRAPVSKTGEFTITAQAPAEYFVQITAPGHVEYTTVLSFEPGKVLPGLTCRLYCENLGDYIGSKAPKAEALTWEKDYQTALKRAKDEKKPLLVMETATWCGFCKKLEQETLSDSRSRHFLSGFVRVKAYEDKEVEKIYGGCNGYPTLVFADSSGKLVCKVVGYKPKLPFAQECGKAFGALRLPLPPELETLMKK
jgi:hypothetical protein